MAASCPLNVIFYACDFGERFLGCCAHGSPADTCTYGCPQEDLLPASFDKDDYSKVTRAACTSGDWWSCADTSPPFLGCCLTNPCLGGCPSSDLTAAIFSQNQTDNPLYSAIPEPPAAASSSTSTAASLTPVGTSGAPHSATASPAPVRKNLTGIIVGGAVGGTVVVAGFLIGLLLLYRRGKSQGHKGSDSTGANEKRSIKDTVSRNTTMSKNYHQKNETSNEFSAIITSPHEESRLPIPPPGYAPPIDHRMPPENDSAPSGVFPKDHEEGKTPQELPPNHAPLPEIASSDRPQPCHELPSSDPAVQEHSHPTALQPGGPGLKPFSPSSVSRAPQPYGLVFRPHSPSRLSVVSSIGSLPPLAPGLSPVSVSNDGISSEV